MKKILYVLVLLVAVLGVYSCKQSAENQPVIEKKTIRTVKADEFEQLISDKGKVLLLDVRTLNEYEEGHLKDAMQIDVKEDSFIDECKKKLPAGKTIAVYCRTGFRSKTAGDILTELGFDVINLSGGYTAWTEAGRETVK